AVVVHHGHAARAAADLETALDAGEAGERLLDRHERDLEVEAHAERGEGVEHVVAAGDLQRALAEQAPALEDLEAARHPREVQATRDEVGARLEAVGDDAL